jgi:hypothetical protein
MPGFSLALDPALIAVIETEDGQHVRLQVAT